MLTLSYVIQRTSLSELSTNALTQVIIDHKTPAGFECVARARQFLLDMGAKEVEDPETADWDIRGCHVVAPVSPWLRGFNAFL